MIDIKIRNTVKEYCRSRNISLRELSRISGVDLDTLYHGANPSAKTLARIMIALNCKFEDLIKIEIVEL